MDIFKAHPLVKWAIGIAAAGILISLFIWFTPSSPGAAAKLSASSQPTGQDSGVPSTVETPTLPAKTPPAGAPPSATNFPNPATLQPGEAQKILQPGLVRLGTNSNVPPASPSK